MLFGIIFTATWVMVGGFDWYIDVLDCLYVLNQEPQTFDNFSNAYLETLQRQNEELLKQVIENKDKYKNN